MNAPCICYSSNSSLSTIAPEIPLFHEDEIPIVIPIEPARKKRKIDSHRQEKKEEPMLSLNDSDVSVTSPTAAKKTTCATCGCSTKGTGRAVRYEALWLYKIVFPKAGNLKTKDRLCQDCHEIFMTSACTICGAPGGSYRLPPTRLAEARNVFHLEVKAGRMCNHCGDKLSKFVNKKDK
jgi:hypothetical protein